MKEKWSTVCEADYDPGVLEENKRIDEAVSGDADESLFLVKVNKSRLGFWCRRKSIARAGRRVRVV